MIEILTQKLQSCIEQDVWNSDDSDNPNLLITPKKDIIVEWSGNGFFEIQRNKVTFNDCVIGHTHCLRKNGTADEWTKFQKWYLDGFENKLFRVDVPLKRIETEITGESWDYTRWMRPGRGIGKTIAQTDIELVPDHMMNIIDIYYNAISALITVAQEYNETNIPDLSFRHLMKDDAGYYFVKNFDLWDQTPRKVIETCITLGEMFIQASSSSLPDGFFEEWSTKTRNKWNTLL